MRRNSLRDLITAFALASCSQTLPPPDGAAQLPAAAPDGRAGLAGSAAPNAADPQACEDLQSRASQLLATAQQCTRDDECATLDIAAPCLLPFLCPAAVSRSADLAQLQTDAANLSVQYRACSSGCAVASCVSRAGQQARCNPSSKRCQIDM